MTGRSNEVSVSTNTEKSSNSPEANIKSTRKRSNQYNTLASIVKGNDHSSGQTNFDLKEALDSARKSFENGIRGKMPNRKRPISDLNKTTSGVSTRSSNSNLNSTSPRPDMSTLSPSEKTSKKSSSAPASPIKPCKPVSDVTLTRSSLSKRLKVEANENVSKSRVSRSELLLIKAEDANEKIPISAPVKQNNATPVNINDVDNPSSPSTHIRKKKRSNSSNSSISSISSSTIQKETILPLPVESKLSLCSVLDSTLDTSFESDSLSTNVSISTNSSCFPILKSPIKHQMPKSPNRMLLSDSKRTNTTNLNKNKPVSMNEVIKLHQDEGVMHLLHGLPSSRRARQPAGAVSATVVRRRPSNEYSQAAIHQLANNNPSQDSISISKANEIRNSSNLCTIPGLVRKSIAAGYGPIQHRPKPRQHYQSNNSLFCPLSQIKPCKKDDLMTSENLELLKHLNPKSYIRLWSSPSRYVLRDQQQHLMDHSTVSSQSSNGKSLVENISYQMLKTSATAHRSGRRNLVLLGSFTSEKFFRGYSTVAVLVIF